MHRFLIAAALSALMAACALEQTDPTAPPAPSEGDSLPAATTSTDEQASTSIITPHGCAGPYYICTATGGPWWNDRNACTASCGALCELVAHCNAACICILN